MLINSMVNMNRHSWLIGPSHVPHSGLSVSRPTANDAITIVKLMQTLNTLLCTRILAIQVSLLSQRFIKYSSLDSGQTVGRMYWDVLGSAIHWSCFRIGMVRNPSQDRTKNLQTCTRRTQYKASRILRDEKNKKTYLRTRTCSSRVYNPIPGCSSRGFLFLKLTN